MEKQKLLFHQARLANRGVAEMVLLHISACKGIPSEMVMKTLQLGIAVLRGGNLDIQMVIIQYPLCFFLVSLLTAYSYNKTDSYNIDNIQYSMIGNVKSS